MSFEAVFSYKNSEAALLAAHRPQRGQVFIRLRDVVVVRPAELLEQFISSVNGSIFVLVVGVRGRVGIDHPQPPNNKVRTNHRRADVRGSEPVEHALQSEDHLRRSRLDDLPPSHSQSRVAERVFRGCGFVDHSTRRRHDQRRDGAAERHHEEGSSRRHGCGDTALVLTVSWSAMQACRVDGVSAACTRRRSSTASCSLPLQVEPAKPGSVAWAALLRVLERPIYGMEGSERHEAKPGGFGCSSLYFELFACIPESFDKRTASGDVHTCLSTACQATRSADAFTLITLPSCFPLCPPRGAPLPGG